MNDDTRSLTELLRQAAPEPAGPVDFERVVTGVRRRRTTRWLGGTVAAAGVVTLTGILLSGGSPDQARDRAPATSGPSSPASVTTEPVAGCPPTERVTGGAVTMIDYVPFIQLDGQQFIAQLDGAGRATRADLGDQVATVTCRIADLTDSGRRQIVGPFLDGNAAYLDAGTPIYAVADYDPGCRVATLERGEVTTYLAHHEVDGRSVPIDCASTRPEAEGR